MNHLDVHSKILLVALLLIPVCTQAQYPLTAQANTPVSFSMYAERQVDLLPGFEATASGIEVGIRLSSQSGGWWSEPKLWTDYQRGGPNTPITGMIGIHTNVLPNGNVLSWEGHNSNTFANPSLHTSHAYEWRSNTNSPDYPNFYKHYDNYDSNIFCSGHSLLADGRLLVAGGHFSDGPVAGSGISNDYNNPNGSGLYVGLRDVNIFNYKGNSSTYSGNYVWQTQGNSVLPAMRYHRWYPTMTTLSDGNAVVVAGQKHGGLTGTNTTVQADIPELFNATSNTWEELTGASRVLPLYPWMFLSPNGQLFNAGPNPDAKFLNPAIQNTNGTRGEWGIQTYPTLHNETRYAGSAVMYSPGRILILGGEGQASVTNTAEIIDINNPATAAFRQAAPMLYPRSNANATLLADGTVLVTGGTTTKSNSDAFAVLPAELWLPNPSKRPGGTWQLMAAMSKPRLYHSTAVLLPDATVLSTGGGQGGGFADHPDYEIFTPPYLCQGYVRPQISSAPQSIAYGQTFAVQTPDASNIRGGGRATLVRLSSVTHSFNMNQRFLDLTQAASTGNQLQLVAPADSRVCPPGHYMLFLLADDGTPSFASIVSINTTACSTALSITQSSGPIASGSCDQTTRFTVAGANPGASYTWTVNGRVVGTTSSTYMDLPTSISSPTLNVLVEIDGQLGCGVTSSLTSFFPQCSQQMRGE